MPQLCDNLFLKDIYLYCRDNYDYPHYRIGRKQQNNPLHYPGFMQERRRNNDNQPNLKPSMKYIIAFDSFKECLSARSACRAAADALKACRPEADVVCLPLSDGGEGLTACLDGIVPLQWRSIEAHDALMRPINATYATTDGGNTAIMEMAATCGLERIAPHERDVMAATTYGVGEMLVDAARRGAQRVIMGIGGSATCDAGQGMLSCLSEHAPLGLDITVACDVDNPLYGPNGAAHVFGPQKGATPAMVDRLDERLRNFAALTESSGIAAPVLAHHPGTGAAGGLGYALMAHLGARLTSGIDTVLDLLHFDALLAVPVVADSAEADARPDASDLPSSSVVVITGEGHSDAQTLQGKVPMGVLRRCRQHRVPVFLLSGAISDASALQAAGFADVVSINRRDNRPLSQLLLPETAMANISATIAELFS